MDNLKILMGSSVSPLEMDDEDLWGQQEESSIQYDVLELVDAIGTLEFKSLYLNSINLIKATTVPAQRDYCKKFLLKVNEVYDFEFLPHPELENQMDMNNVYDFLKFINFGCISFLGDVWRFLKVNLREINVHTFCTENQMKVISEIEDQIQSRDDSELISIFLRTYNKEGVVGWFSDMTQKYKMLILLRIAEGLTNE